MTTQANSDFDVAVVGAGNIGIAVAYYLAKEHGFKRVALIDNRDPMSLTSAQSGENYRDWFPHPTISAFTAHSVQLMEKLDIESGGRLNMTRGGYALVTRRDRPEDLINDLYRTYAATPEKIRIRDTVAPDYQPPLRAPWNVAPDGVDVLVNQELIRRTFPTLAPDVKTILHVRNAGSISAQQMGQYMLEEFKAVGGQLLRAEVKSIAAGNPFVVELVSETGTQIIKATSLVNAAGPYLKDIGAMLGEDIPVESVFQQKISFQDREGAIPRNLPFTIDLDGQVLAWSDEDRELLASDPSTRRLTEQMPGGIHIRPDGAPDGTWIKTGWAYNHSPSDPHGEDPIDPQFPDSLLRAVSRLHPKMAAYIGRLPRGTHHYGGYYTMTEENWPLIGPMRTEGAFIAGALSGYGSMAACATGSICAALVAGKPIPEYAHQLSPERYKDEAFMSELRSFSAGHL